VGKKRTNREREGGENMKSGRMLITGGAGLIGSHIADQLVRVGAGQVVVLDNFVRGRRDNLAWASANGRVTIVQGEIRDRALLAKIFEDIDVVFHQAAIRITQCAEEPRLAMEVLVDGTYNVLEAAVVAGVRRVIAASSASVYGMADEFPTTEQCHPYHNRTLYGAAKAFNEALLRSFNEMYGLDYVALRYFNVYGPRMDVFGAYTEVLIRWMERIAAGKPPLIFGDGKQTMDFINVEDVARANLLAAELGVPDDVYNIASGVETSLDDLARTLIRVMGSDLQPQYGPERKVNPISRRLANTEKAKRDLGFEAEVALEEGLRSLVSWWRRAVSATPADRV
jgi:nucleoside-diphosphate-sugar epimerase